MTDLLYVERICHPVMNLGPGRRVVLWLQGCSLRCPGCLSPELFERRAESASAVADVIREICAVEDCDGLTVSGGEPFEQAIALAAVLDGVRRTTDMDIMVYSGHELADLKGRDAACADVLALTDILVDGPYRQDEPNSRLWRGSDNQQVHLLTARAQRYIDLVEQEYGARRSLHFTRADNGDLVIIGIPERGFRRRFTAKAAEHGLELDPKAER